MILLLPLDGRSVVLIGMLTDTPFFYHSISCPLILLVHQSHHLSTLLRLSLSLLPLLSAVYLPIGGRQNALTQYYEDRRKKARALSVYKNHRGSNALTPAGRRHGLSLCTKTTGARFLFGSHLKKHKPYFGAPAKTPNALAGTHLYPPSLPAPLEQWYGTEYENCEATPEHGHSFLLTILALLLSPPMCPRLSHRILQNAAMAPQLMLSLRPIGHAASYVQ